LYTEIQGDGYCNTVFNQFIAERSRIHKMMQHSPALLEEVMSVLMPAPGETVLDVTLGLAGHAAAFLSRIGTRGNFIGIDADPANLEEARQRISARNTVLIHANFSSVGELSLPPCDIIFADLGLSSPHLDHPGRGFSFREDGPLDCRFDPATGRSAAELLSESPARRLEEIFRSYGEVSRPAALSNAIVTRRKNAPIATTGDVVRIAESVYGWQARKVLPQIFQALRIAVNDELEVLQTFLTLAPGMLRSGGRLGIISYHSLEDRRVKQAFRTLTTGERHPTESMDISRAPFRLLTPEVVRPGPAEIAENPRSRSARFRAIIRSDSHA
jgi:16S rRNA (cytosine1402-N4)-methyltransferase